MALPMSQGGNGCGARFVFCFFTCSFFFSFGDNLSAGTSSLFSGKSVSMQFLANIVEKSCLGILDFKFEMFKVAQDNFRCTWINAENFNWVEGIAGYLRLRQTNSVLICQSCSRDTFLCFSVC